MNHSIARYIIGKQTTWLHEQHRFLLRWLNAPRAAALAYSAILAPGASSPTHPSGGVTAHDVVLEHGTLRLLRYRRSSPATQRTPILFSYALINRSYILDLLPGRSVVQRYLDAGFEVYMIDWGVPSAADRGLSLYHYVCDKLGGVVNFILATHGLERLHLLGYCMGGTLASAFGALEPERLATLTLLAAPIDFSARTSLLEVWADPRHFDVDTFIDAHGNCPAAFLQACFLWLKPVENLVEKYLALYEQLDDESFLASFFALERWVNDNIPVAGETFREFVRHLFQQNQLVLGQLSLGGRAVELGRIECPLLILTADNDHLVPPASTQRVRDHVGSRDVTAMTMNAGHVGLVMSGKAHKSLWPGAVRWLSERSASTGV